VTDRDEMRRLLRERAYFGVSFDGTANFSSVGTTIRMCHHVADGLGLSGEDRYVLMAWHLHIAAMRFEKMVMDAVVLQKPVFIVQAGPTVAWRVPSETPPGGYVIFQQRPTHWYENKPQVVEELVVRSMELPRADQG
jgi:hypothetical protein